MSWKNFRDWKPDNWTQALAALAAGVVLLFAFAAYGPDAYQANQTPQAEGPPVAKESAEDLIATYTLWLTGFTGVLAIATMGLIRATNRLGERADKGMRQLERAYVHLAIVGDNLGAVVRVSDPFSDAIPQVHFELTNHGKTPAYIVEVHRWVDVEGLPGTRVLDGGKEDEMMKGVVIGAEKTTRPGSMSAEYVFTEKGDRELFARSEALMIFRATIVYQDIFERGYIEHFRARYNVTRARFDMWRWEEPWGGKRENVWRNYAANLQPGQRLIRKEKTKKDG